jgi:Ca-activated chloride channel family protein
MMLNDSHDSIAPDDPRLTAYALGELEASEVPAVEALLAESAEARAEVDAIRAMAGTLGAELAAEPEPGPGLAPDQKRAIESALGRPKSGGAILRPFALPAIAAAVLIGLVLWSEEDAENNRASPVMDAVADLRQRETPFVYDNFGAAPKVNTQPISPAGRTDLVEMGYSGGGQAAPSRPQQTDPESSPVAANGTEMLIELETHRSPGYLGGDGVNDADTDQDGVGGISLGEGVRSQEVLGLAWSDEKTAAYGKPVTGGELSLDFNLLPAEDEVAVSQSRLAGRGGGSRVDALKAPASAGLELTPEMIENLVALGYIDSEVSEEPELGLDVAADDRPRLKMPRLRYWVTPPVPGSEGYEPIVEQGFETPFGAPRSTFSIDVDTASYANVRRFLQDGQLPPLDAVRIEELINYFDYAYPQPDDEVPFAVSLAVTEAPWAPEHRLVRIGLKGREIEVAERAPSNLVFLVDVSGSMNSADKLQLLVASLKLLVGELDERDRVALVTYAGSAGLVLDSTPCTDKAKIIAALDNLRAGGSTHGSQGIQLAYEVASRNYIQGATNRVILATDGDFNVGITDRDNLHRLIETSAKSNVFLSVLLFGTGNIKDNTAELLADKGNGNYNYIDSFGEARKVLVNEMGGTLITIAKDVKIQVEFNPAKVGAYRLIGYENRALAARDFNDDTKDAGEIGAGHTVTAIYEIVPRGVDSVPGLDPLKYQETADPVDETRLIDSDELLTVALRYKQPEAELSTRIVFPLTDAGGTLDDAGGEMAFATAVAAYGMLLRHSNLAGDVSWDTVLELAERGRGADKNGYRAEFIQLVKLARGLSGQ